jgi:predicted RNase H-like nuclease (RuvC/YqgF family)
MKKNIKKKENLGNEKLKTEMKQIRTDLKRLKKSKQRLQLLWYRTKKEHVALIKDLDQRLKALRKGTRAKKTTRVKKSAIKPLPTKTRNKKTIRKALTKKARAKKSVSKPAGKKARTRLHIKKK